MKTKAIVLNSPHNPTGSVLSPEDIVSLRELVKDTNIFIISDEVYEHLILDGLPHCSMLRYPDLFERSFVCFSFGKVFHCTGWKQGYCVAPEWLTAEFRKFHQFNAFQLFHTYAGGAGGVSEKTGALYESPRFYAEEKRLFPGCHEGYPV